MLSLRPMTEPDLLLVAGWLRQPHVIRWWGDTTVEVQVTKYRDRIRLGSRSATHMLTVLNDGTPVGWCQWYRWSDFPDDAAALEAGPGEVGLDYAIGDPASTGPGAGTELIAAWWPKSAVITPPPAFSSIPMRTTPPPAGSSRRTDSC